MAHYIFAGLELKEKHQILDSLPPSGKFLLWTDYLFLLHIGVDALVTYNFHKARESPFYLISSRIINKLIYFR